MEDRQAFAPAEQRSQRVIKAFGVEVGEAKFSFIFNLTEASINVLAH